MSEEDAPRATLLKRLGLLWLTGVSMRITILAVPPVIPLIHAELHLSEAQVGFLVSLPLLVFALAAVPGALLVHRLGTSRTLLIGMAITAAAAAGRGGAATIWTLFAATFVMGFGVATARLAGAGARMDAAARRARRRHLDQRAGHGRRAGAGAHRAAGAAADRQ